VNINLKCISCTSRSSLCTIFLWHIIQLFILISSYYVQLLRTSDDGAWTALSQSTCPCLLVCVSAPHSRVSMFTLHLRNRWNQMLVAHTSDPGCLWGSDWEYHNLRSIWAVYETPSLKITEQNGLEVWLKQ
jgi:hypothetical protein